VGNLAGQYKQTLTETTNSAIGLYYAMAILILIPAALAC